MKSAYLSPPRDPSPKKLSCFSSQGRVDFLQLMIESKHSNNHMSNEANHFYKGNNIEILITATGAVGMRGAGDLFPRERLNGSPPSLLISSRQKLLSLAASMRAEGNPPGPLSGSRTATSIPSGHHLPPLSNDFFQTDRAALC